MTSVFLVRSEHLNHEGNLFGGDLMAEIDTIAYCLLREKYHDRSFVTRAAEISFERPASLGATIIFEAKVLRVGTTSVQVGVTGPRLVKLEIHLPNNLSGGSNKTWRC